MHSGSQDLVALIGRILVVGLFLVGGWGKINGLDGTAGYIASKNLPMPQVLAIGAAVVELVAPVLIIIGFKTRLAALVLAAFTLAATVLFHDFWNIAETGPRMQQYMMFSKNTGILGGLLMIVAFGAGRFSIDGRKS